MIPDYCEAITAYRAFDVCDNGLLVGQAHAEPWPPFQPFVARCGALSGKGGEQHIVDGHFIAAPVFGCDCGIHVLKAQDAAKKRIIDEQGVFSAGDYFRAPGRAWGTVKIWGRVIEHEIGYRAEFSYPSALTCESQELAEKIAALYGIPCAVEALPKSTITVGDVAKLMIPFKYYQPLTYQPFTVTFDWASYDVGIAQAKQPPAPMIAPAPALGANRWQQRQARIQAGKPQPRKGFRS